VKLKYHTHKNTHAGFVYERTNEVSLQDKTYKLTPTLRDIQLDERNRNRSI